MRNPNIAGRRPPNVAELAKFNVNRLDQLEAIWQPYYDYQVYPAAGQLNFTFFQRTVGTAGTTLANTNMQAAGSFPSPTEFVITGIQAFFIPGGDAALGGQAVGVVQPNWVDVNAVSLPGNSSLVLTIGSKPYLREGPIGKFPPVFSVDGRGDRSDANIAAAAGLGFVDYARASGSYYSVTPFRIPANQNFDVAVQFPALVPVAEDGQLCTILDGYNYRLSQ